MLRSRLTAGVWLTQSASVEVGSLFQHFFRLVWYYQYDGSGDRSSMGPTNDHELAIARIVDKLDMDGKLSPSAIENVISVLDFTLSRSDSEFLVRYIRWRMDNPIWRDG